MVDATIAGFYTRRLAACPTIPRLSCSLFGILQQTQSWRYNKHREEGNRRGTSTFSSLARSMPTHPVTEPIPSFNGDSRYLRIWSIAGKPERHASFHPFDGTRASSLLLVRNMKIRNIGTRDIFACIFIQRSINERVPSMSTQLRLDCAFIRWKLMTLCVE